MSINLVQFQRGLSMAEFIERREGGTDLWEIISVRLYVPTVTPEQPRRPILYLYAQLVEA